MSGAYHASVNVICFESCVLRERQFPLAFYGGGGGLVCEVDCKVSDWLTCISQRTKRTVAFCRRGLGREGIGTSMMMQYYLIAPSGRDSSCERREMSVYLRREVDTKKSSLIRRLINKAGVTSLFALKERKYLNIIDGFVWFACGVR